MATRRTDLAYRIPEQIADTNRKRLARGQPFFFMKWQLSLKCNYHYYCLSQMHIGHQRKQTNMRCAQCRRLIFGILDLERQNRYLSDEDEEICPICQDRPVTEIELGKMICSCTARFHYRCLVQYMRCNPEYNPFLNNGIKCVTCNGIAAGIERITRNRH